MTFEEFTTMALREISKIFARFPEVEKTGARRISVAVWENGHVDFDIAYSTKAYSAYVIPNFNKDDVMHVTRFDIGDDGAYRTAKDIIVAFPTDGIIDDIPTTATKKSALMPET